MQDTSAHSVKKSVFCTVQLTSSINCDVIQHCLWPTFLMKLEQLCSLAQCFAELSIGKHRHLLTVTVV